jgi:hypothetical protein
VLAARRAPTRHDPRLKLDQTADAEDLQAQRQQDAIFPVDVPVLAFDKIMQPTPEQVRVVRYTALGHEIERVGKLMRKICIDGMLSLEALDNCLDGPARWCPAPQQWKQHLLFHLQMALEAVAQDGGCDLRERPIEASW